MLGQANKIFTPPFQKVLTQGYNVWQVSPQASLPRNEVTKSAKESKQICKHSTALSNYNKNEISFINGSDIYGKNAYVSPAICILSAILSVCKNNELIHIIKHDSFLKTSHSFFINIKLFHTSSQKFKDENYAVHNNERECIRAVLNGIPNINKMPEQKYFQLNYKAIHLLNEIISDVEDLCKIKKKTSKINLPNAYSVSKIQHNENKKVSIENHSPPEQEKQDNQILILAEKCNENNSHDLKAEDSRKYQNISIPALSAHNTVQLDYHGANIDDINNLNRKNMELNGIFTREAKPHASQRALIDHSSINHDGSNKKVNIVPEINELESYNQTNSQANSLSKNIPFNKHNEHDKLALNILETFKEWHEGNSSSLNEEINVKDLKGSYTINENPNKIDDNKHSNKKMQNHIYKFPMMLKKELPSTAGFARATYVSNHGKSRREDQLQQKNNKLNTKENIFISTLKKHSYKQTASPKESAPLNPGILTNILKEHKVLLQALLDKVDVKKENQKISTEEFKPKKPKISKTKFEQLKYDIFKQIWNTHLESQEKSQEKVKRINSDKTEVWQCNPSRSKYLVKTDYDSLPVWLKNLDGGLSHSRDYKPIGNQIGDTNQMTGHKEDFKKKCTSMTSPSKKKDLTKALSSSRNSVKSLDLLQMSNLDTPKLELPNRSDIKTTPLMRLQTRTKVANLLMKQKTEGSDNSFKSKRSNFRMFSISSIASNYAIKNERLKINQQDINHNTNNLKIHSNPSFKRYSKTNNKDEAEKCINLNDEKTRTINPAETNKKTQSNANTFLENTKRGYHKDSSNIRTPSQYQDYQLSDNVTKFMMKKKSMEDLKNKILKRNESIKLNESKFTLDKNKLFKLKEKSLLSGPNTTQDENTGSQSSGWKPDYYKKDNPRSDLENSLTPPVQMTTPNTMTNPTPPTPDYQIMQASAIPVSFNMFQFNPEKHSKLGLSSTGSIQKSEENNQTNQPDIYNSKTNQLTPPKRNWIGTSPVTYVDIVSEFRDKKSKTAKEKQFPLPEKVSQTEVKKPEEKLPYSHVGKSNSSNRNWTGISPVTFLDTVLEFRFKKPKQQKGNMSTQSSEIPAQTTPTLPETPAPRMYNKPNPLQEMIPETKELAPTFTPTTLDEDSQWLWNEPFKTY